MFTLDDEPKSKRVYEIGQKLEELSVGELTETITLLQDEIIRLEKAKADKSRHLDAAAALFAKKS